jgi:hypothetical protein
LREVKREYKQRQRAAKWRPRRRRALRAVPAPGAASRRVRVPRRARAPREHGRLRGAVSTVVGLALVAGFVVAYLAVTGGVPQPRPREAAAVPNLVPTTPPKPAPADPFAGSKVEHWAVGTAGLTVPAGKATGGFSARQVQAAYAARTAYLRAAMLDERVLYRRDLRPVLATLDPATKERMPTRLANVFGDDVRQSHAGTRVNGLLTPRAVGSDLYVDFSYVAVYALRPGAGGETELVAVKRTGSTLFRRKGGGVTPAWLYLSGYTSDHSRCGWKWPDTTVEVWLGPAASAPPSASYSPMPDPRETVNLLDPRAPDPKGCFDNTGEL